MSKASKLLNMASIAKAGKKAASVTSKGLELAAKHPKITGAVTAVSGTKDVAQAIKRGLSDKANRKQLYKGLAKAGIGTSLALFNHPEWYEAYNTEGLINLNFGKRKGISEDGSNYIDGSVTRKQSLVSCVGIPVELVKAQTQSDDWNQGIQLMYSNIRSANAGAVNYSQYDLERYVYDVRNVHAIYSILRRAYACLRNINQFDSTTPQSYFYAMGLDYDSFAANAANLKQYANLLSLRINRLLPLNIDLINRTRWMFSNGFADSDDAKAIPYFFILQGIYDTTATSVEMAPFIKTAEYMPNAVSVGMDYTTLIDNITPYINRVTSNQTYAVIAGDILKAFGEDSLYPSEVWNESMELPIIYDEAALSQIQNATLSLVDEVKLTTSTTQFMTQVITEKVTGNVGLFYNDSDYTINERLKQNYINSARNNINAGNVMSLTRLSHFFSPVKTPVTGDTLFTISTCGTEIALNCIFIVDNEYSNFTYALGDEIAPNTNFLLANIFEMPIIDQAKGTLALNILACWSQADWAPRVIPCYTAWTEHNNQYYSRVMSFFDFNNYATLYRDDASAIHGYATLSLLATKRLVKQSNSTVVSTL